MKYLSVAAALVFIVFSQACSGNTSTTPSKTTASTTSKPISVLAPKALDLAVGDTAQIHVVVRASDNTLRVVTASGTWTSSNDGIASVSSSGIVTAYAPGTVDITVKVTEGTATVTVTVSNTSQPLTFAGGIAAPNSEAGTLTVSATTLPSLSAVAHFQKVEVSLIGRLDDPTHIVDVSGDGYRFLGVVNGNVVTGAYVDTFGLTGGFAAINATHTAVTSFCGTYTSDGTTVAGGVDAGSVVLSVAADGTAVATTQSADASGSPLAFVGNSAGGIASLATSSGRTFSAQVTGEGVTGSFNTAAGSTASFSITSSACP